MNAMYVNTIVDRLCIISLLHSMFDSFNSVRRQYNRLDLYKEKNTDNNVIITNYLKSFK